jgi:aspartate aminotransferase-like enzyme
MKGGLSKVEPSLLMIPGPVHLHERIIKAMGRQMISHRGIEFAELMKFCTQNLKKLFGTKSDVYIISGSSTSGMEAAISSFSKVRRITCVDNGKFGERLAKIAERYTEVECIRFDWGKSIELDRIEDSLSNGSEAVLFVHNETSTGILNPAEKIAKLARKYNALVIMDGITSVGGDEVEMDRWGIDVAVVGSQKCIGIPPGLAAVAVSEKAWEFYSEKAPFYLDLAAYRKLIANFQTPYTPAIPLFFALEEALKIINEEGLEKRIKRHRALAKAVREWAVEAGLQLFPELNEYSKYSNTITAIKMPSGITDVELRSTVQREYGIAISGGQEHLKGKIFRIGNMGNVGKREIVATLAAVQDVLMRKRAAKPALHAAMEVLRGEL